jgi:hypothetical protein
LWAGVQLVRAFYSILAKDMELIAGSVNNEKSYMIIFAVDMIVTILGISWIAKYYWQ